MPQKLKYRKIRIAGHDGDVSALISASNCLEALVYQYDDKRLQTEILVRLGKETSAASLSSTGLFWQNSD